MGADTISGFDSLLTARLAFVTGKGGVGKTTVAAALALAGAGSGRRTLLVDVEERQSLSRAFETQPWDHEEREFRPGLWGAAIDPHDALHDYLETNYGMRRVSRVMSRTSAADFVTTIAPGLRDLLLLGKLFELEKRRRADGRRGFDLVVVDAPPTGRLIPFLRAPDATTEIVRVGPVRRQAAAIDEMLTNSERTRVFIVTLLEEMPVTEAVESIGALRALGADVGPVIANQVLRTRLSADDLAALEALGGAGIAARARDGGADLGDSVGALALGQAALHRARLDLQDRMRARLEDETDVPRIELPLLTGASFDPDDLVVLADHLALAVGEPGPRAERELRGRRRSVVAAKR